MPFAKKNVSRKGTRKVQKRVSRPRMRTTLGRNPQNRRARLPQSSGYVTRGGAGISFGTAPRHDTFGSGLRLSGRFTAYNICRISSAGTNQIFHFDKSGGTQYSSLLTSEVSSYMTSGTLMSPIWGSVYNTSSVPQTFLKLFSQFALRKMVLRYCPAVTTALSGQLAIGCVKNRKGISAEETTLSSISSLSDSFTTPFYKDAQLTVVNDNLSKPAPLLFDTQYTSTPTAGSIEHQIAIVGCVNAQSSSATEEVLGTLQIDYVVDLYQLRGISQTAESVSHEILSDYEYDRRRKLELLVELRKLNDEKGPRVDSGYYVVEPVPVTRERTVNNGLSSTVASLQSSSSSSSSSSSTSSSVSPSASSALSRLFH